MKTPLMDKRCPHPRPRTLLCILFMLSGSLLHGQCLEKLKTYLTTAAEIEEPAEGKVYFIHFTTHYTPRHPADQAYPTVDSKIYRAKGKLYLHTPDMEVHQDRDNSFLIIHPLKKIIWHKDQEALKDLIPDRTGQQRWVLDHSKEIYCKPITSRDHKERQQVKLLMDELIRESKKVQEVTIDFDKATGQPLKVVMQYGEGHRLLRQTVEYHQLDYDYPHKKLTAAKANIFSGGRTLLPALRQYELIEY